MEEKINKFNDKETLENQKDEIHHKEYMDLFISYIEKLNQEGEKRKVESLLHNALEVIETPSERWMLMVELVSFYRENKMFLKMDKLAKQMIKEFPDNYVGYHSRFLMEISRGRFEEARKLLELVPDDFKNHPIYHQNYIELYENMGEYEKMIEYMDTHVELLEIIPEYILKKKILACSRCERFNDADMCLIALADAFEDKDAKLTIMILLSLRQDYGRSAAIARKILKEEEKNRTFRSFMAYGFQIQNVYMLLNGKLDDVARKEMNKALDWMKDFIESYNDPEKQELIEVYESLINDVG